MKAKKFFLYSALLLFIFFGISAFVLNRKLRTLSDKRGRCFQSLVLAAAESEDEINNFSELKNVSYVAANSDFYKRFYFGWPFDTPNIVVLNQGGYVTITEDKDYPQSLFKSGKISQKLKRFR